MSVYVDDMHLLATVGSVKGNWSHLWADTEAELFEFADRLGLKRSWVQRGSLVHFDVVDRVRLGAIEMGAIPLGMREAAEQRRSLRADLRAALEEKL